MKYIVVGTTLLHDGKRYEEGAEVELTAPQAKRKRRFLRPLKPAKVKAAPNANPNKK